MKRFKTIAAAVTLICLLMGTLSAFADKSTPELSIFIKVEKKDSGSVGKFTIETIVPVKVHVKSSTAKRENIAV